MRRRQVGESTLGRSIASVLSSRRTAKLKGHTDTPVAKDGAVVDSPVETPLMDILKNVRYVSRPARDGEYLHVSDLLGKCIRKIALRETLEMPPLGQSLSLSDELTFAQGEAIHDVLKRRVALGARGHIWGRWECVCKTTSTQSPCLLSEVDPLLVCPACKGPLDQYREVPIQDDELMIVGTPDLITYLPEAQALRISELKSISHDKWKELVRPDPEHVIQVLFYWYLAHRAGYRLASDVSILYATKGWLFNGQSCKEFSFKAAEITDRLEPYLEEARQLVIARKGGVLPTKKCLTPQYPDAKKCEVCTQCFHEAEHGKPVKVRISSLFAAAEKTAVKRASSRRRPVTK